MVTPEVWQPDPNDWFDVRVLNVQSIPTKRIFFGTLSNNEEVIIPLGAVKHAPHQHYCGLRPGDVVWCRLEPSRTKGRCLWSAIECRIDGAVPEDNHESGTIAQWNCSGWGVIKRTCGCQIMAVDAESFSPGDTVAYRIFPDPKQIHAFIAADLKLIEGDSNGSE